MIKSTSKMTKLSFLKQKKKGIILVLLGLLLSSAIILFLYFTVVRIQGFSELLPANETAAYVEFPVHFSESAGSELTGKINSLLKLDFDKEVAPWASEKAALAFFTTADPKKLTPFLLIETKMQEPATAFLENYKNRLGGGAFVFVGNIAVIAPSKEALAKFSAYQADIANRLASDAQFVRIRQNIRGQFFLYLKPKSMPAGFYESVAMAVPQMPPLSLDFPAIGIGADKNAGAWVGNSYLLTNANAASVQSLEQAYRAQLMPFLPPDFDAMIAGQNAAGQGSKFPPLKKIIDAAIQEYFPGAVFERDIAPLVQGEFALAVTGPRALFITELPQADSEAKIANLRAAFQKVTPNFALTEKEFTLLDGTKARELVPNPADIAPYKEDFGGTQITGFTWNSGATGIFDAITQNKWFISNDLGSLKKSLSLTSSFRETDRYRNTLQSILKNPELLGTATLPEGIFSFSKRTFADHLETNFIFASPK